MKRVLVIILILLMALLIPAMAMANGGARANITELTDEQVIAANPTKVFRPVFAQTPAIPAAYAGKYMCLTVIATDAELTEEQMDQLEASIESIAGIHKAFVMIGPARIPLDRIPEGYELKIGVEGSLRISLVIPE